jgi:hypothetical protein
VKVFSTITSPVFSEFVIVVGADEATYLPLEVALFETLRTVNEVRPFKLVFLLVALDPFREETRQKLAEALDSVTAGGILDFFDSPLTIRSGRSRERWSDTPFN